MPRLPDVTALGPRPSPQPSAAIPQDTGSEIAQAAGGLLSTAGTVANELHTQNVNMARAQSANALLDHEIAVKSKAEDIQQRIDAGALSYTDARKTFDDEVAKLPTPSIRYVDPITQENLQRGVQRLNFSGQQAIDKIVDISRRLDFKSQFAQNLDKLGKLAGMPDANIEDINGKAEMFRPLALSAGLPKDQVDKALQDFKDRNWLNNATQRAMQAKDNLPAIKSLETDLTSKDGFYAGKLDTDKRNAVLRQVINDRLQIENRLQHEADKHDASAERALYQIDQQIASGVPATAEMWSDWADTVKGTPAELEFKERQSDETEVQSVLRQPIQDQVKFIQDKQSDLSANGGSLREKANLTRLDSAVKANIVQLQGAPLLFNANRIGQQPKLLDTLTGADAASELNSRIATLTAMRKQYGDAVQMRPLLPQEAKQLSAALDRSTPQDQAQLFSQLRQTINDNSAYRGAMQQIAPDSPVRALAGMIGAKQAQITTASHWFKPNEIASSGDVATTLLQGEQLLNQTKAQKAEDGKPKTGLYLPSDSTLQADFQNKVGAAFANRPGAAEIAYQAVKAYYVGKAAQTGRLAASNQDIDTNLVREAIDATLGSVVDYAGHGEVFAPWGMDKSEFDDRADYAVKSALGNSVASNVGLRNAGENTYYVVQGKNFVYKDGRPLVIDISQPPPRLNRVTHGRAAVMQQQ